MPIIRKVRASAGKLQTSLSSILAIFFRTSSHLLLSQHSWVRHTSKRLLYISYTKENNLIISLLDLLDLLDSNCKFNFLQTLQNIEIITLDQNHIPPGCACFLKLFSLRSAPHQWCHPPFWPLESSSSPWQSCSCISRRLACSKCCCWHRWCCLWRPWPRSWLAISHAKPQQMANDHLVSGTYTHNNH